MRRGRALATGIIVATLIITSAVPANSATRLRVYKGETSQGEGHGIKFKVARTDNGRFIREMDVGTTLACEDGTTQGWGFGFGLSNLVPITEGSFSFDDVFFLQATHVAGELGSLRGSGTLSITVPTLTEDEQGQICTTGDLTWEVEYVRTITRPRLAATESAVVRAT